jgi:hypothetical protein
MHSNRGGGGGAEEEEECVVSFASEPLDVMDTIAIGCLRALRTNCDAAVGSVRYSIQLTRRTPTRSPMM